MTTPAGCGRVSKKEQSATDHDERTPAERHAAMTWAQRLKRVSSIDIETGNSGFGPLPLTTK